MIRCRPFLYTFFVLLIAGLLASCVNSTDMTVVRDPQLSSSIQKEVEGLDTGRTKEVNISLPYSLIVAAPPYATEKDFADLGLSKSLSKTLKELMTYEENVHLFIIEQDSVKEFTVLDSKFATKDEKAVKVEYPAKLKIEKTTGYRPFVISN